MTTNDLPATDERDLSRFDWMLSDSAKEIQAALDVIETGDGDVQDAIMQIDDSALALEKRGRELLDIAQALRDERDGAIRERVSLEHAIENYDTTQHEGVNDVYQAGFEDGIDVGAEDAMNSIYDEPLEYGFIEQSFVDDVAEVICAATQRQIPYPEAFRLASALRDADALINDEVIQTLEKLAVSLKGVRRDLIGDENDE